ncbi:MAG: alpha/beta hydrolase [Tissierellia bacterium]|nr:alpha/beta hydrolase [Tissierellia bacterium]
MYIKEYGIENEKKMLFLPGAFSDYSWYIPVVELLSEQWHIFLVIYDGYHEPYEKSFISVEHTIDEIIDFIEKKYDQEFDIVYGLSMGGAIANLIYAYDRLKINTLIIDGGVSPYRLPYILTRLILMRDILGMKILRSSKKIMKMAFPPDRWLYPWEDEEEAYDESIRFMNRLSHDTIKNCFDSCNNYTMPDELPKNDTKIYLLYGELERKDMALDIKYFRKIYPKAIYEEFADTDHGELSTIKYKEFMKFISSIN